MSPRPGGPTRSQIHRVRPESRGYHAADEASHQDEGCRGMGESGSGVWVQDKDVSRTDV